MLLESLLAFLLATVHLVARGTVALSGPPRSVWLSTAGGISVAYVFLHLLPELHEGQHHLQERGALGVVPGQSAIYLVALGGLVLFYGLEHLADRSRSNERRRGQPDSTSAGAFWLHVASFGLYNLAIGYLLVHGERDNLLLYGVAMGLHFVVNDHSLREHHKGRYDRLGRWLLAAAVLGGWALGLATEVSELSVKMLIAVLAGGVILNVVKEELPQERESRFGAFLGGAALYGAVLLAAT
ncbi:hypothetical protein JI739_03150 [Ramlibacter sp. AW1]|uniref:ZIP Zinc transporter n=1 Tax=Ramlibacter aurantiacus TaxID=2801330 RepID=A0A936ZE94_9BURK|nr:hypothetical protein [Ramlibacter aurantiacus]MBL0419337.1 hypothetical protein [Ramlibacter aurantiacus]